MCLFRKIFTNILVVIICTFALQSCNLGASGASGTSGTSQVSSTNSEKIQCDPKSRACNPYVPGALMAVKAGLSINVNDIVVTPNGKYIYSSGLTTPNENSNGILGFKFQTNGNPKDMYFQYFVVNAPINDIVVTPDSQYAFLLTKGSNIYGANIYIYKIEYNGKLSPVNRFNNNDVVDAISITPDSKYMYVVDHNDNYIREYRISNNGFLTMIAKLSIDKSLNKSNIKLIVSPNQSNIYLMDGNKNKIYLYNIMKDGRLVSSTPSSITFSNFIPSNAQITYDNRYMYTISKINEKIDVFKIVLGGLLQPVSQYNIKSPSKISIDHKNQFLYILSGNAYTGQDSIHSYKINNKDGTLTKLSNLVFPGYSSPHNKITISPDDKYLYYHNLYGLSVFNILGNGIIRSMSDNIPTGKQPTDIVFTKSVDYHSPVYAYVTNKTDATISMYQVSFNGNLDQIGSINTEPNPTQIILSPASKFAYVIHPAIPNSNQQGGISLYNILPDGTLSENIHTLLPDTFYSPSQMLISNDGKYAYVLDSGSEIIILGINEDGTLSRLNYLPYLNEDVMSINQSGDYLYVISNYKNGTSGIIRSYNITNALEPYETQKNYVNFGANELSLSPNGAYGILQDEVKDGLLSFYQISPSGEMININKQYLDYNPSNLVIDLESKFIYVLSTKGNYIAMYSFNNDGIEPLFDDNYIIPTGDLPRKIFAIERRYYEYIYTLNSDTISIYRVQKGHLSNL